MLFLPRDLVLFDRGSERAGWCEEECISIRILAIVPSDQMETSSASLCRVAGSSSHGDGRLYLVQVPVVKGRKGRRLSTGNDRTQRATGLVIVR